MKTSTRSLIKKDKVIGNPKTCKRWLVWFRRIHNGTIQECCGTSAWYPINNSISINTIDKELLSSNVYKYKPKGAEFYRIWGGTIREGNFITEIKQINYNKD